jgi:hypothetical protein
MRCLRFFSTSGGRKPPPNTDSGAFRIDRFVRTLRSLMFESLFLLRANFNRDFAARHFG